MCLASFTAQFLFCTHSPCGPQRKTVHVFHKMKHNKLPVNKYCIVQLVGIKSENETCS